MNDEVLHPGEVYRTAQLVQHVHALGGRCLNCTAAGCTAAMWAVEYIAKVHGERTRRRVTAILLNGAQGPPGLTAGDLRTIANVPIPDDDR